MEIIKMCYVCALLCGIIFLYQDMWKSKLYCLLAVFVCLECFMCIIFLFLFLCFILMLEHFFLLFTDYSVR